MQRCPVAAAAPWMTWNCWPTRRVTNFRRSRIWISSNGPPPWATPRQAPETDVESACMAARCDGDVAAGARVRRATCAARRGAAGVPGIHRQRRTGMAGVSGTDAAETRSRGGQTGGQTRPETGRPGAAARGRARCRCEGDRGCRQGEIAMKKLLLWCLLAMGPLLIAVPVTAAEPVAQAIPWSSLNPAQQQTLSQFEPRWSQLPPERQLALSRGADRWGSMNDAQRERARDRFQRWRQLPEPRRQRARESWNQFQRLPPAEQARLREDFREFRQLLRELRNRRGQRPQQ